jgi:hypothetical protein
LQQAAALLGRTPPFQLVRRPASCRSGCRSTVPQRALPARNACCNQPRWFVDWRRSPPVVVPDSSSMHNRSRDHRQRRNFHRARGRSNAAGGGVVHCVRALASELDDTGLRAHGVPVPDRVIATGRCRSSCRRAFPVRDVEQLLLQYFRVHRASWSAACGGRSGRKNSASSTFRRPIRIVTCWPTSSILP